ncbi:MAG: cell division protein FtsX [Kangiellaceae bacterium]|nr:cell division protein FtsX [Kangiellaceae bacterium]
MAKTVHKGHSATTAKVSLLDRIKMALSLHKKNSVSTLLDILRQPANSLMTILVLAIALALPSAFYVFSQNAKAVSGSWNGGVQMALFLKDNTTEQATQELMQKLNLRPEFDQVTLVSKQQALEEFKSSSGFGDALEYLDDNPLPAMLVLTPSSEVATPSQAQVLVDELQQERIVDVAQMDMQWVQKYHAMLDMAQKIGSFVSILLAMAVLLIVGNTIRLAILNRREEIQVIKLVGATDGFIRRPFLYTGFWYGLIAALLAALMVNIVIAVLRGSASTLAELYSSGFSLMGLAPSHTLSLLAFGAGLGLIGAWISVNKHLRDIQPN